MAPGLSARSANRRAPMTDDPWADVGFEMALKAECSERGERALRRALTLQLLPPSNSGSQWASLLRDETTRRGPLQGTAVGVS
jgi:hypothetical protein